MLSAKSEEVRKGRRALGLQQGPVRKSSYEPGEPEELEEVRIRERGDSCWIAFPRRTTGDRVKIPDGSISGARSQESLARLSRCL